MYKLLVAATFILAFLVRIIFLSNHPVGFTPDEASFGYDAYSILKTGKDQWGIFLPFTLRSFGDFKLPAYTYITIPSVALFGLNEFAVRLPNAIFGTLAVLATYLMAKELFSLTGPAARSFQPTSSRKAVGARWDPLHSRHPFLIPILAALLLAISSWHISLSRGAFEANLTTFFLPFGLWAFLKAKTDPRFMIVAALALGINIFTYHTARILTPVVLWGIIFFHGQNLKKIILNYKLASLIFCIFLGVAGYTMFFGGSTRGSNIAIFNPTDQWSAVADRRYKAVKEGLPDVISRIFSNKAVYLVEQFSTNYLSYLSPQFLFTQGAGEWTYGMIPGRGVLYFVEIVSVLAAVWAVIRGKVDKKIYFIIFWILVSPLPAALTKGPGYAANRVAFMMPAIQILSAYGAIALWSLIKHNLPQYSRKLLFLYFFTLILSFSFFLEDYFYHAPESQARGLLFGRRQALETINLIQGGYNHIIISRSLSEPQIYAAFYQKINPAYYQKESANWLVYEKQGLSFVDQLGEYRLGKYIFKNIDYAKDQYLTNSLLLGQSKEFPMDIKARETITYPDGSQNLLIFETKK